MSGYATNFGKIAIHNAETQKTKDYYVPIHHDWIHHEIKLTSLDPDVDLRFSIGAQKSVAGGYFDNLLITSVHGPSTINHDGYNFLYKGF